MSRAFLIALGLLTGASLLVGGVVDARVQKIRDDLFEIGPDCDYIHFRSGTRSSNPADLQAQLDQFADWWLRPTIRDARKAGAWSINDVTVFVLDKLFPECSWPPSITQVSRYLVWRVFRMWVSNEIECDPLSEPPSGMICVDDGGTYILAPKGGLGGDL